MTRTSLGVSPAGWVPLAVAAAALCYLSWVLAPWVAVGSGLDPVTTYASELAATDQPRSGFFRVGDLIAGLLVAGAAAAVLAGGARRRIGWVALLAFGIATIGDASAPLSCAPSADAACAAREAAFDVPWTHTVHVGTSVAASVAMLIAVVALTPLVTPLVTPMVTSRVRGGWAGGLLLLGALGNVVGTAWTMLEVGRAVVAWPWPPLLGIAQRVQVGSASLWLLALGVLLWQARAVRTRTGISTTEFSATERT